MKPKTISEIERIDSFTEGHKIEYGELVDRVMIIEEDVVNTVNNQTTTLSSVDSMKSIITKVADVPKITIMASDMLNNLLGDIGDCEDLDLAKWNYMVKQPTLDASKKMFGSASFRYVKNNENGYIYRDMTGIKLDKYYILLLWVNVEVALSGPHIIALYDYKSFNNPAVLGSLVTLTANKLLNTWVRVGIKFKSTKESPRLILFGGGDGIGTYNFDGIMLQEITADEYNNLTVDQLLAKYPYVNGVQPLLNPCLTVRGKNLLPSDIWELGQLSLSDGSLVSSTVRSRTQRFISCKATQTYTVTIINNFAASRNFVAMFYDKNYGFLGSANKNLDKNVTTFTFATSSKTAYVKLYFSSDGSTPDLILQSQLEEGTVATAYEPYREKQRIYPCTLGKVGNFADKIEDDGIEVRKTWRVKNVILDGALDWVLDTVPRTGFKNLYCTLSNMLGIDNALVLKFDGKRLVFDGTAMNGDVFIDYGYKHAARPNKFLIAVFNSDSGWGDNYAPTVAEIKAYFNGWKMNNGTFGTPYDGAGTKTWTKWNAISNTGSVTVVPTTMADGFTPYQLWYVLAQEEQEIIEPVGSLKLEQGYNCIDVSTGIAYERANPVAGSVYNINNINTPGSLLKYKVNKIIGIFKNKILDTKWNIVPGLANAYGKELATLLLPDFDSTATYTAKYEVLHEDYNSQQVQVTMEYADNLRTSHNELVEIVEKQEDEINDLLYDLYYSKLELELHQENYASNENVGHIKLGTIAGTALDGAHDTDKVRHITEYIVNNSITDDANNAVKTGIYYLSSLAINRPNGVVDGALLVMSYNSSTYTTHFFLDWRTNKRYTRVRNNGTWGSWEEIPGISYNDGRYVNSVTSATPNDPNTTQIPYIITNHANSPNAGTYWHIYTMFYASLTSNRAQIAVRYNADINEMYIRALYGSTWTDWTKMAHANPSVINVSASKAITMVDVASVQNCTNASAITITIPTNSSTPFPLGTEIGFIRSGAGTVTFSPASGVTINSSGSKKSIKAQHETCALKKIATDTWILTGSLA